MLKSFVIKGDLEHDGTFRITDGEEVDAKVADPVLFFDQFYGNGWHLVQVIPTLYTCSNNRMSLNESVWILEMAHLA